MPHTGLEVDATAKTNQSGMCSDEAVAHTGRLTREILDLDVAAEPPAVLTVILTALVATSAGWGASLRAIGRRPEAILRT